MNFTGGSNAGKIPLQGLKKSLGWIIISIVGSLLILWFVIKLNDPRFVDWLTRPALADRLKEAEKPRVLVTPLPPDNIIYPWPPGDEITIVLNNKIWQGVANTQKGTRVVVEFITRDIPLEERLDNDPDLISPIGAVTWTNRVETKGLAANIIQWRVRMLPGQTLTRATVVVRREPK